MKKWMCTVLLLPFFAMAQDCKIKKQINQFSKLPTVTTGFISLGGDRVSVTADNKEIDFFFSLADRSKCFDDASTLMITFEDGRTKSNFRNSGTMNCEGLYHFVLRNTPVSNFNLERLSTKKVKSLKFTNGKIVTEITLNEEQQMALMTQTACLAKEAKTLLQ